MMDFNQTFFSIFSTFLEDKTEEAFLLAKDT